MCLILLLLFGFSVAGYAQSYQSQRLEFAAYNVGFNALAAGVGAAINKKPDQTPGNAFLKGLGKGALGSLLIHQAKASVYQIIKQEQYVWAWPAKITNTLGSSIVQHAAANRGMFDRLHLNLWFVRADYSLKDKQFLLRLVPSQVYGALYIKRYGDLNFSKSLQTGLHYYDTPLHQLLNGEAYGYATATSIAVGTPAYGDHYYYNVVAHEVMHTLQYESAVGLNPYLDRIDKPLKDRYSFYKTLSCYVYLDLNYLASSPLRTIGYRSSCHLGSFMENEA